MLSINELAHHKMNMNANPPLFQDEAVKTQWKRMCGDTEYGFAVLPGDKGYKWVCLI